ncbi:MAG: hypothetical protein J5565_02745, partial [Muribaculaceae bacterium]|nr:hypothetical protein [Muribaculaceae bacterium]
VNILIFDRNPLVGAPPLAAWRSPVRFSCIALTLQQENLSHFLFELPCSFLSILFQTRFFQYIYMLYLCRLIDDARDMTDNLSALFHGTLESNFRQFRV